MKDKGKTVTAIRQRFTKVHPGISVSYTLYSELSEEGIVYSIRATIAETDESALVHDVTRSGKAALRIFDIICRGGVTPCCLTDVAEDLIVCLSEEEGYL